MYKITTDDGKLIGMTEAVRYIKVGTNGSFVMAKSDDAQGIVYKNITYNLDNKNIGANTTVFVSYIDAGEMLLKLEKLIDELKATKDEKRNC